MPDRHFPGSGFTGSPYGQAAGEEAVARTVWHYCVVDADHDNAYFFRTRWGAERFARRWELATGRHVLVSRHRGRRVERRRAPHALYR